MSDGGGSSWVCTLGSGGRLAIIRLWAHSHYEVWKVNSWLLGCHVHCQHWGKMTQQDMVVHHNCRIYRTNTANCWAAQSLLYGPFTAILIASFWVAAGFQMLVLWERAQSMVMVDGGQTDRIKRGQMCISDTASSTGMHQQKPPYLPVPLWWPPTRPSYIQYSPNWPRVQTPHCTLQPFSVLPVTLLCHCIYSNAKWSYGKMPTQCGVLNQTIVTIQTSLASHIIQSGLLCPQMRLTTKTPIIKHSTCKVYMFKEPKYHALKCHSNICTCMIDVWILIRLLVIRYII